MTKAVTLANLASGEALTIDETNDRIGIASTSPSASVDVKQTILLDGNSGVVTATSFVGDGSSLTGVANTDFVVGTAITMVKTNFTDLNVSGSATVSGQLSVGGTINYEDVTNVDSVGVVTARIGIKVLAGGINAVGVITATSFSGDGANLTNVGVDTATVDTGSLKVSGITTLGTLQNTTVAIGKSINYGNVQKAFFSDHAVGVGTTTTTGRNAGLGTAPGTMIYNVTTDKLEVYSVSLGWISASNVPFNASGGTETTDRSGYKVHEFTSPGTFTVSSGDEDVEILVVGGGGAGGGSPGPGANAGGGAGALYFNNNVPVSTGSYTVTIGAGGPGDQGHGNDGEASSFGPSYPAAGGGGGGARSDTRPGNPGGSGGGASQDATGGTASGAPGGSANANSPSAGWGNNGGSSPASADAANNWPAGGGGGASAAAQTTPDQGPGQGTPGGAGLVMSIEGPTQTFAGGGGGGTHQTGPQPSGGSGGGGTGGVGPGASVSAVGSGTANTGGGGGGTSGTSGGSGGSGKVVIAYPST